MCWGICLMVGTIATVDLRLVGAILREQPVTSISKALLPYTWAGFGLMLLTGLPLFAAESMKLYGNPALRIKLFTYSCSQAAMHCCSIKRATRRSRSGIGPKRYPRASRCSPAFHCCSGPVSSCGEGLIAVFRAH